MSNIWSASNDPLFYLHHAQIDHIWSLWQGRATANAAAIGGPIYPNGTGTVTGDYPLEMTPFNGPGVKASMVLDIGNKNQKGVLCYTYVHEETGVAGYKRSIGDRIGDLFRS
jgi:tyrosinase